MFKKRLKLTTSIKNHNVLSVIFTKHVYRYFCSLPDKQNNMALVTGYCLNLLLPKFKTRVGNLLSHWFVFETHIKQLQVLLSEPVEGCCFTSLIFTARTKYLNH